MSQRNGSFSSRILLRGSSIGDRTEPQSAPLRPAARGLALGVLLVLLGLFSSASQGQDRPTSDRLNELSELRRLLAAAQVQLNVHHNNDAALLLLQQAVERLDLFSQLEVNEQESTKWQLCEIQTGTADRVESDADIVHFSNSAIECWRSYISWYGNLPDARRAALSQRNQDRIQLATRYQFNSILRRGTRLGSSMEDLFALYVDYPSDYFAPQTVDVLLDVLARCPTWAEDLDLDFGRIKERVCRGGSCRSHWQAMRDFLDSWRSLGFLSKQRRKSAERWIGEIDKVIKCD